VETSDGVLSLVYKNCSWHRSLEIVQSHSRDSLLWHWIKPQILCGNGCLCQDFIWPPRSVCGLLSSYPDT
jgi:hypothetical protein